jgi:hypothetical protein
MDSTISPKEIAPEHVTIVMSFEGEGARPSKAGAHWQLASTWPDFDFVPSSSAAIPADSTLVFSILARRTQT